MPKLLDRGDVTRGWGYLSAPNEQLPIAAANCSQRSWARSAVWFGRCCLHFTAVQGTAGAARCIHYECAVTGPRFELAVGGYWCQPWYYVCWHLPRVSVLSGRVPGVRFVFCLVCMNVCFRLYRYFMSVCTHLFFLLARVSSSFPLKISRICFSVDCCCMRFCKVRAYIVCIVCF